jgi:hypothetical protein
MDDWIITDEPVPAVSAKAPKKAKAKDFETLRQLRPGKSSAKAKAKATKARPKTGANRPGCSPDVPLGQAKPTTCAKRPSRAKALPAKVKQVALKHKCNKAAQKKHAHEKPALPSKSPESVFCNVKAVPAFQKHGVLRVASDCSGWCSEVWAAKSAVHADVEHVFASEENASARILAKEFPTGGQVSS